MPRVNNPSGGAGSVLSTDTLLTAAQVQQLHTTPVQIIPAPGPGLVIVPIEMVAVLGVGTQPFETSGSDALNLTYTGLSNVFAAAFLNLITRATNTISSKAGSVLTNAPFTPVASAIDNTSVSVNATANYTNGAITTATIGAAGAGYAVNDTGTINGGSTLATYIITSIGAAGAVTGFTVTAGGQGYTVANNVSTTDAGAQPGVGAGFQVNITAVQAGNGTLRLITNYTIVPVP